MNGGFELQSIYLLNKKIINWKLKKLTNLKLENWKRGKWYRFANSLFRPKQLNVNGVDFLNKEARWVHVSYSSDEQQYNCPTFDKSRDVSASKL